MDNKSLVLKTGIELNFVEYKKLMREIIDADPSKGMSITINDVKEKQKSILKDVKLLNKYHLEEGEKRAKSTKEFHLILSIVNRGWEKMKENYKDKLSMIMDIEYAHKDCPLKLQELFDADDMNFYHDIIGIGNNIDRATGKLKNCFVPRFAKQNIEPDLIENDRAYNQDLIQRANDEEMI